MRDPAADVPAADPVVIRAALPPTLVAEFDQEWNIVLDHAKQSHDLNSVFGLLTKWQHIVVTERRQPGAYFVLLAKTEQILHQGRRDETVGIEEIRALIACRQQAG